MKTERDHYDQFTANLLDLEKRLQSSLADGAVEGAVRSVLDEIEEQIRDHRVGDAKRTGRVVRTSKDLDQFLQLSMMYLTAHLANTSSTPSQAPYKATISIFYPEHDQVILVKPCFYYPGNCAVRHPTISLARAADTRGAVGHSGRSLLSREVLYCADPCKPCADYVQLDMLDGRSSVAALCVPLHRGWEEVVDRFIEQHNRYTLALGEFARACFIGSDRKYCDSPYGDGYRQRPQPADDTQGARAVLNLECATRDLSLRRALAILDDPRVRRVLGYVERTLDDYRRERGKYKVLRTCNSLFQLLQHNLSEREVYRALLREISRICDGADVTLHLQDLPLPPQDLPRGHERRCVKLLVGVGRNFRGFLINERYGLGDGLVGTVLETAQPAMVGPQRIAEAMAEGSAIPFKQLMPNSCLNIAIPLLFHNLCFGVLNVEWDEQALGVREAGEVAAYAQQVMPLLERLADYLAQVIDYYEDRSNASYFEPEAMSEERARRRTRELARRQVMDYYISETLAKIHGLGPEEPEADGRQRYSFLKQIIDAVGYLVGLEKDLRIMVSLRECVGAELKEVVHHGLARSTESVLPVGDDKSVLGVCAALGVPLFGPIEEKCRLQVEEACLDMMRPQERERLRGQTWIRYVECGNAEPRYEVAVPLVFGRQLYGTLDFELFSLSSDADNECSPKPADRVVDGPELRGFLEWARAIAFCRAYRLDHDSPMLSGRRGSGVRRFQRLCAQVIANAQIRPDQEGWGLATEYMRELAPSGELRVTAAADAAADVVLEGTPLVFRGRLLGALSIVGEATSQGGAGSAFPEHPGKGPGGVVARVAEAYCTSALFAAEVGRDESSEFIAALATVRKGVETALEKIAEASRDASQVVVDVCEQLHLGLESEFGVPTWEYLAHNPSRYAYFIHLARYDPEKGASYLHHGADSTKKIWARADTEEMNEFVREVKNQETDEDRRRALAAILKRTGLSDGPELYDLCKRVDSAQFAPATIRDVLLERLMSRVRPVKGDGKTPSFTRHVLQTQEVQSAIDFNMSPFRSPRETAWFWRRSNSILGIPIVLGNTAIGVLNISRRRQRDDFSFFKQSEIDAAWRFKKFVTEIFAKLIDCREVEPGWKSRRTSNELPALRGLEQLAADLRERVAASEAPILTVACSFASRTDWLESLCKRTFGGDCCGELGSSVEQLRGKIVWMSYGSWGSAGGDHRLREIAQVCEKLIVFADHSEAAEMKGLPRARERVSYDEDGDIEQLAWERIEDSLAGEPVREAKRTVLFRRAVAGGGEAGEWSLLGLAKRHRDLVGVDEAMRPDGGFISLHESWRPFAHWHTYSRATRQHSGWT